MSSMVTYERQGEIGIITANNPPVNALGIGVRKGLAECIGQGLADAEVKAMVIVCEGRTFFAGADIREFGKPPESPWLPEVLVMIESSAKPIVAAIHGTAFGGGLEVALACHYRCAVPSAQLGLPEVKLGLLPGAGGTQRLPRLIGVEPALKMITSGDPIGAKAAKGNGLVDELVEGDLREGAAAYAKRLVANGSPAVKIRDLTEKIEEAKAKPGLFDEHRKSIAARARGNKSALRCIDAVEAAVTLPFDEGIARERALFQEAVGSDQSAALRYVFFSEREVGKVPGISKETPTVDVKRGAVLGAGTMGGGIAMNFVNAGIPVTLIDVNPDVLERGLATIQRNYASTVSKGRMSQEEMDKRMGLISGTTDFGAVGEADLVIEAVFEDMALKKEIFGKLDAACAPEAVLATNTSTLDVNEIAESTSRPEQVLGMHFFSPANVMRLLEIVRGAKTSPSALATAMGIARTMGKIGAVVGVCDGFVGNRMLHQYTREAAYLIEEGALPQQVDKVITDFGLPMGPFTMGDLAGLDIGYRVRQHRKAQGTLSGRYAGHVADRLCVMERFGQKTSAGYYRYEQGSRTPIPDPDVEALILKTSEELGIERRAISDDEILARCLYPMINEAAKILDEGIALRASDVDIIWINGYGFPAHRGGPMFYADQIGVKKVYDSVVAFQQEHGDVWKPANLLKQLAESGGTFSGR